MKYISHLDLMRMFMRALRRADFPLKMTEGFSPHPKFSIKRALKLGLESDNEEATVVLKEQIDLEHFKERLQKQLPDGILIKDVSPLPVSPLPVSPLPVSPLPVSPLPVSPLPVNKSTK